VSGLGDYELPSKLIAAVLVAAIAAGWLLARRSRPQPISPAYVHDQIGLALMVIAGMLFLSALTRWMQGPSF
jgi:hypothetical protein